MQEQLDLIENYNYVLFSRVGLGLLMLSQLISSLDYCSCMSYHLWFNMFSVKHKTTIQ